jgi:hypothetical protein
MLFGVSKFMTLATFGTSKPLAATSVATNIGIFPDLNSLNALSRLL